MWQQSVAAAVGAIRFVAVEQVVPLRGVSLVYFSFNDVYILMSGVSSDGLLRCAMCSLRPAGPGTPVCPGCAILNDPAFAPSFFSEKSEYNYSQDYI